MTERLTDAPPEAAAAEVVRRYEDRSVLIGALQRLGPRQRAVIVLRYWMGLTEHETAASLNCAVGTVKSQASRGLAMLRQDTELVDEGFQ